MSSKRSNASSNLPDAATLARVEAAVAGLARTFAAEARETAAQMQRLLDGVWPHSAQSIFRLAHDLKGQGKTFGFPEVTRRAAALCVELRGAARRDRIEALIAEVAGALVPAKGASRGRNKAAAKKKKKPAKASAKPKRKTAPARKRLR